MRYYYRLIGENVKTLSAFVLVIASAAAEAADTSAGTGVVIRTHPSVFPPDAGDGTAVRLSAPGAVRHDVAHQVAHVVLQISDDVLDDVSDRDHAHDLARVQHW